MKGEVVYADFTYPSKLDIPIEAFVSLETALKKQGKIEVVARGKYTKGVYYIFRVADIWLKDIQEEMNKPTVSSFD